MAGVSEQLEKAMARRHSCGGEFVECVGILTTKIRGVTVEVEQDELRCSRCGEIRVSLDSAEAAEERAGALVRDQLGLLHPGEIRDLREGLGLTQAGLESQLGLGPKTVVRWESGRVMQNKATDNLLRLIRRDATALAYLSGPRGEDPEVAAGPPSSTLPKSQC